MTEEEILAAMQFSFVQRFDPLNTTADGRYVLTYQYAGSTQPDAVPTSYDNWTAFTEDEQAAFEEALAHIETFLNVEFVEVQGEDDPDIEVGKAELPVGVAGTGSADISARGDTITRWDGYVVYDHTRDLSQPDQFSLLLHEVGHALGLDHPFDGAATLPDDYENNKYTVMSYTENPDNGFDSDAMMVFDVLALQDIWGAADYNKGATTYTGPRTQTVDTIWDSGGHDTFDASDYETAVTLDLREGEFSTFGSYPDVSIAYGTVIEDAKGGAGDDILTGNAVKNEITGYQGSDSIMGYEGDDLLIGKKGDDTLNGGKNADTIKGGDGKDKLDGKKGTDTLEGGAGNDKLQGGALNDVLRGGDGNDKLNGNQDDDKLKGGAGADTFVYTLDGDKDRILDFEDDVDQIQFKNLGTVSQVLAEAEEIDDNVVFKFGGGDKLTVKNMTIDQLSDDIFV